MCNELGENRAGVHTCIPGEGAQCRIVAEEQDSENREYSTEAQDRNVIGLWEVSFRPFL